MREWRRRPSSDRQTPLMTMYVSHLLNSIELFECSLEPVVWLAGFSPANDPTSEST